jgi:phosphoribosylanthranilate isomerase
MLDQDAARPRSGIWCKICGITNSSDAEAAQRAGADALGFNFYPASARFVELDRAYQLAQATRCAAVALLVNPSVAQVEEVIERQCFDLIQFSGDESAEFCASFGVPYMKSVRMRSGASATRLAAAEIASHSHAWAILLDTFSTGHYGGTGQTFDWTLWPDGTHERLVLAGGLDALNVGAAIAATKPFGVDVSGGVEGPTKGIKDHVKMEQFIKETRSAKRS